MIILAYTSSRQSEPQLSTGTHNVKGYHPGIEWNTGSKRTIPDGISEMPVMARQNSGQG
jgi:hypothetical protein